MKKIKLCVFIPLLTFLVPILYSIEINESVSYKFLFSSSTNILEIKNDFLFKCSEKTKIGPFLSLGTSYAYYNKNGSKAHIYGPSFSIGIYLDRMIKENLDLVACISADCIYASFPTILWGACELGAKYRLSKNTFLSFGGKILVLNRVDGGINLNYGVKI